MSFQRSMTGDVLVLTPRKNLVGGDETTSLLAAIDEEGALSPARIGLELGEISWVSSLGLAALKRASIACASSGGWLRLARVDKRIKNSLLITGIIIYCDTFDTVAQAVSGHERAA